MAAQLTWQASWAIGIEQMDTDHREMMRLLNLLFTAGDEPEDPPGAPTSQEAGDGNPTRVLERMDAVLAHLRAHFSREEEFLQSISYPQLEEHSGEHALEMAELIELRRALARHGASALDEGSIADIKRWFFNHVIAEDRRYAEFYLTQVREDPPR